MQRNRRKQQNQNGKDEISSRKLNTKGIFHVKMGTIKDRNSMDLTEAEDTKKREEEYTEEQYKKVSMNQITILV